MDLKLASERLDVAKDFTYFLQMKSYIWLGGWQTGCILHGQPQKKTNRSLLHEVLVAICFPALFLVETPHEGSGCLSVFSPVQRKAGAKHAFFSFYFLIFYIYHIWVACIQNIF
eukprot:TRINITY_DN18366_c1_g1_i3.p1 TRINITY_DN18366_c1_g1~~TRINITY_DN18366_c1_g1_i3.p1  ORF type:complete len:114 (-),score=17.83 TRINITY_DN18366_c1_g1_i3:2028-2369(-)